MPGCSDPAEWARRHAMLHQPHMRALTDFAADLRCEGAVPDFDPLDGGVGAGLLFLLEKPGPSTIAGSGMVSRDNNTATAAAIQRFMHEAKLDRVQTVLWNAVPWWNGTMRITAEERRRGITRLPGLIARLPRLRAVVLVGNTAGQARAALVSTGVALFASAHPSPQVRAAFPDRWREIPHAWARARHHLDGLHPAAAGS